jgi:invasion protein IalB
MTLKQTLIGAALGLALACGAAAAQDAAAPAAAAATGQQQTKPPETKTIGDWIVRCFPIQSPSPCDMFQELVDQRSHQRVLSLSFAYVPNLNRHGMQLTVPLEVGLQKGATISSDSYTSQPFRFRYCDRGGCFVQTVVDNAAIESLAKSGPDGKVRIYADSGKAYDLKFSLKGFAAAHDDMVEQAKAKATKTPPPAAAPATP